MRITNKDAAQLKLDIFRTIMSTNPTAANEPAVAATHANCVYDRLYCKEPKRETTT